MKLMRVPPPAGKKSEGTALMLEGKLIAYSRFVVGLNWKSKDWEWKHIDFNKLVENA